MIPALISIETTKKTKTKQNETNQTQIHTWLSQFPLDCHRQKERMPEVQLSPQTLVKLNEKHSNIAITEIQIVFDDLTRY